MPGMQNQFVVQHDLPDSSQHSRTVREGTVTNLAMAMLHARASVFRAYVCHIASDLQLHKIGPRFVWLDSLGKEQPEPRVV